MKDLFKYQGKYGIAIILTASRGISMSDAWKEVDKVQRKIDDIRNGIYSCSMAKVLYDDLGVSAEYLIFFLD